MKPIAFFATLSVAVVTLMAFRKSDATKTLPKTFREKLVFFEVRDFDISGSKFHTDEFYMSTTEVTNAEYRLFLSDLKAAGEMDRFEMAKIDSTAWRESLTYNEPFVEHYHKHPAYDNYPVVNISYEGALEYCHWMEKKLNSEASPSGQAYEVRLPTKAEWVRAARGNQDYSVYAWGGAALQNAKGCILCNYMYMGDESVTFDAESGEYKVIKGLATMGVAGHLKDNAAITAPVYSYSPSNQGLYNMNGNVAEMVAEQGKAMGGSWRSPGYDVRNESESNFSKPMPTVGFRPLVIKKSR
jgi:formylglycine-generating enzyme required for sulfatase activity